MTEPTRDELLTALSRTRDERFAVMLTLAIGIAAETHPDELRKAMAQVFDLTAYEAEAVKLSQTFSNLLILSDQAHNRLRETEERVKKAEAALDRLRETFGDINAFLRRKHPGPVKAPTGPVNGTVPTQTERKA
jgi:hypothetical protein